MTARDRLAAQMSEAELQKSVNGVLDLHGWVWHHETDSRKSKAGFPDLVAVHPHAGRVAFIELKDMRRKVTPGQAEWLAAARAAGAEAYVWRPSHWLDGTVQRVLRPR